MLLVSTGALAASVNFIKVERFLAKPQKAVQISPYSISLESFPDPLNQRVIRYSKGIKNNFIYLAKVTVDKKTYYRLMAGNFKNRKTAALELTKIKKYYPDAWINLRSKKEQKELARLIKPVKKLQPVKKKTNSKVVQKTKTPAKSRSPEKLLELAKQEFLDKNYSRVLDIADQVFKDGNLEQVQRAMELTGIVRERQNQFALATAIYKDFLVLYPDSELSAKIQSRLDGLNTMLLEPRSHIDPVRRSDDSKWAIHGALSQYYRDDTIQSDNERDTDIVHTALVTDVDLLATRKTNTSTLVLQFDGGIYRDIEDEENDSRISYALIKYTDTKSGYQVTGGRQRGTAKGVYSRFEGLVYKGLSNNSFNYSIYLGSPVLSSYDDAQTDRQFVGTNVHFSPFNRAEMDIYLLQQKVSDLTDREAIGTEFEYRRGSSYLFSLVDYDLFYGDLNNFTLIGSFPYSENLDFNLSYDLRNSPQLTTSNALAGQNVASIEELNGLFSEEEIYQLAEDRTSQGQNLNIGSNYQIDNSRQIYLSLSYASLEETIASGGVPETPTTEDIYLAGDYSIRGFFSNDDYTSFGLRLSDTNTTNVISMRARSYIPGSSNFGYDPRIRLDYRENKDSDQVQWVINSSIKLTYRPSRKLSFETGFGVEYSDYDLPLLDDQTAYTFSLGYLYQF